MSSIVTKILRSSPSRASSPSLERAGIGLLACMLLLLSKVKLPFKILDRSSKNAKCRLSQRSHPLKLDDEILHAQRIGKVQKILWMTWDLSASLRNGHLHTS